MTRKQIIDLMERIFNKGLHAALVVWRSPVDNKLEERHIYADEYAEIDKWIEDTRQYYTLIGVKFCIWVNDYIMYSNTTSLIEEEDCADE